MLSLVWQDMVACPGFRNRLAGGSLQLAKPATENAETKEKSGSHVMKHLVPGGKSPLAIMKSSCSISCSHTTY